jgi:hypothetical protein
MVTGAVFLGIKFPDVTSTRCSRRPGLDFVSRIRPGRQIDLFHEFSFVMTGLHK